MSLTLNVSPQTEARFTAAAQERGVDPAMLFEQLVNEHLPISTSADTSTSLYDRFKDVIGTVEGLPPDLAQNPEKYLSGFGHADEELGK